MSHNKFLPFRAFCGMLIVVLILAGSALAAREQAYPFLRRNGSGPEGGVIVDAMGNFYGTTFAGGTAHVGVVYEISPAPNNKVNQTVLYNFTGNGSNDDGANPMGDLVFDGVGNLYGMTTAGGPSGKGTVFELLPPAQSGGAWTETVLFAFTGGSDGGSPQAGLVFDQAGNLYGTAQGGSAICFQGLGCGVVFELSPPLEHGGAWTETVLYSFSGGDGGAPAAPVIFDQAGNLYGTTLWGGQFNLGTVFALSPPAVQGDPWAETVIHSFNGTNGSNPQTGLTIGQNGTLYGATIGGGSAGEGTIFQLTPVAGLNEVWTWALLHTCTVAQGSEPMGTMIFGAPNTLYGTTDGGPVAGTVFQLVNVGGKAVYTDLYDFAGSKDGGHPHAGVTLYKNALYGTTLNGGYKNNGVAFMLGR